MPIRIDKGYVALTRTWKSGDTIELNSADAGAARARRTSRSPPITGAWPSSAAPSSTPPSGWTIRNGKVRNLMLPDQRVSPPSSSPTLLKGVDGAEGQGGRAGLRCAGQGACKTEQDFTAIPYYAWANRGRGQMMVWLPDQRSQRQAGAFPTLATTAKVQRRQAATAHTPTPSRMAKSPSASNDTSSYFDWWPNLDEPTEWVEYDFEKPATVSECELYWFDDTGRGAVRVPASGACYIRTATSGSRWRPPAPTGGEGSVQ